MDIHELKNELKSLETGLDLLTDVIGERLFDLGDYYSQFCFLVDSMACIMNNMEKQIDKERDQHE